MCCCRCCWWDLLGAHRRREQTPRSTLLFLWSGAGKKRAGSAALRVVPKRPSQLSLPFFGLTAERRAESNHLVLNNMTDCCSCCCAAAAVVYEYVSTERCAPRALLLVPKPASADCCSGYGEMHPSLTARRTRRNDAVLYYFVLYDRLCRNSSCFLVLGAGLFSCSCCGDRREGGVDSALQAFAPAGLRGARSTRPKSRLLATNHGSCLNLLRVGMDGSVCVRERKFPLKWKVHGRLIGKL